MRTFSSVEVVSSPQKAVQSFAINPAEIISLPRLTVPAARGTFKIIYNVKKIEKKIRTCKRDESSSSSCRLVCGCTNPPWLENLQ